MFCPQCGGQVGESEMFCRFCGARVTPSVPERPPRKRRRRFILLFVAIVVGASILLSILPSSNQDSEQGAVAYCCKPDTKQQKPQTSAKNEQPLPAQPDTDTEGSNKFSTYKIGEPFSIGYWSYQCNGAYRTPALGYDYSIQRANGVFVVVDITARNDDTSSSTLPRFQLVDKAGRTYDESSEPMLEQGFLSALESLNPGVSKRGRIAFDVPADREYALMVSGGIESGEHAVVLLGLPTASTNRVPGSSY